MKATQARNRYAEAQSTLSKVFLIQSNHFVLGRDNLGCVLWNQELLGLSAYDPTNEESRRAFIAHWKANREDAERLIPAGNGVCEKCARLMGEELEYAERRRFSAIYIGRGRRADFISLQAVTRFCANLCYRPAFLAFLAFLAY
jgi:hypothetical protein